MHYLALFSAGYLPSLLVPLTTLGFASAGIAFFLIYAEREDPTGI